MKTNQARDLMLLAIEAFANRQFQSVGTLFAASMSSDDAGEFILDLDRQSQQDIVDEQEVTASATEVPTGKRHRVPMSVIAASIAASVSGDDLDSESDMADEDSEDEDGFNSKSEEDEPEEESEEDGVLDESEEDNGEEDEDDDDEDGGGDEIPSSISSAKPAKVLIAMTKPAGVKSPVKIRD